MKCIYFKCFIIFITCFLKWREVAISEDMAYLPKGQFIDKLLVRIGGDDNFELFFER